MTNFQKKIKPWMMPIAMLCGILFHSFIARLQFLVPYLIFTMLFITFCRLKPSEIKITSMIWKMLAIQILGSVALFLCLKPLGLPLAQAAFICVLCPTATAAPVVTAMLGGSIARVATYSIFSNLTVALLAPFLFVWVGDNGSISFFADFLAIASKVAPMILVPLALALLTYYFAKPLHNAVAKAQSASFYLWAISLFIVVGRSVSFVMTEPVAAIPMEVAIALCALLICIFQFIVGRKIGKRYGDPVSAGQGLAQKNTVLAIWMALTYLEPISSVGPAAYIIWQNSINSAQIYRASKRGDI